MKIRTIASVFSIVLVSSCVWDELPVDVEPIRIDCNTVSILLELSKKTDASVCGASDGEVELKVTGGEAPYTFAIDDGVEQASPIFSDLPSAVYSFIVFDKNRCSSRLEAVVVTVDQFSVDFTATPNSECLDFDGVIEITVNETNGPYKFRLDSGEFVPNTTFENVQNGDHYVTIEDADGCSLTRSVTVGREVTNVSWQNDILPIMTSSCAVTGCHNGVNLPRDWRVYSQVKTFASTIRTRTRDRSMPAEGTLTDEQIALISCWIDDGAPQN